MIQVRVRSFCNTLGEECPVLRHTKTKLVVWWKNELRTFSRRTGFRYGKRNDTYQYWIGEGDLRKLERLLMKWDLQWQGKWFTPSYCGSPHHIETGKPINHKCCKLPVEALRAELGGLQGIADKIISRRE